MTSVESGSVYSRKQKELSAPNPQVLSCTTMNSEEDEAEVEAVSAETPDSKDSWLTTPEEVQKESRNTSSVTKEEEEVMRNTDNERAAKEGEMTTDTVAEEAAAEKPPVVIEKEPLDPESVDEGSDEDGGLPSGDVVVDGFDADTERDGDPLPSSHSTDSVVEDEASVNSATSPVPEGEEHPAQNSSPEEIAEEDEDDFGDFEDAEPDEMSNEACRSDDFGDFNQTPEVSKSDQNAPTSMNASSNSSESMACFLKLKGRDYAAAVADLLFGISPDRIPADYGASHDLTLLRQLNIQACTESRLGAHLLYLRPMPAGFLRSSGVPVVLSSQIDASEQRVLDQLGLREAYVRAQREEALAHQPVQLESSSPSVSTTPSGKHESEVPSSNEDLNLDLDFLVRFSSQQFTVSGDSSKSAVESVTGEDLGRPSQLHELFDGILESSQSSFVSLSSGISEVKRDDSQVSISTPQTASKEPCLNEQDWDGFVDATEELPECTAKTQIQEVVEEEWNEFRDVDTTEPILNEKKDDESDIFSSDWLKQLRSSHETSSHAEPQSGPTVDSSKDADQEEWGTFVEAPRAQTSSDTADPFESLMPIVPEMNDFYRSQQHAKERAQASSSAAYTDLRGPKTFLPEKEGQRTIVNHKTFTTDNGLLSGHNRALSPLEEEDWGGFQG